MLCVREDPASAYRRAAFDARVRGAAPAELVMVCLEEVIDSLVHALAAESRGSLAAPVDWLGRAHAALVALELGVAPGTALSAVLGTFYAAARSEIVGSLTRFDRSRLSLVKADLVDIAAAMRTA